MMSKSFVLLLLLFLVNTSSAYSQGKETLVTTEMAVGHENDLDTYISPEKYGGTGLRFVSEVLKEKTMLQHEGAIAFTTNRSRKADEISGHYDFAFSLMFKRSFWGDNLNVRVGGMVDFFLGFAYNTRSSSNNPAQGYASLAIGPNIMLSYRLSALEPSSGIMKFLSRMTVNYQMRMPWVGMMFSPNYGQSYYELFSRGNYDHNIVFTSIAVFQMRHMVSVDIPLKKRVSLRVGYMGDIRQAKPNGLRQHQYYNAATIGVVVRKK